MRKLITLLLAFNIVSVAYAQAFLPEDSIGTLLEYEISKNDSVSTVYYKLVGKKTTSDGIWMDVGVREKPTDEGFVIKLLRTPSSISMDFGDMTMTAINLEKEVAKNIKVVSDHKLLSIPLSEAKAHLGNEESQIKCKVASVISVYLNIFWSDKRITGHESIDLPVGEYDTFVVEGKLKLKVKVSFVKRGADIRYKFWIAPGVGVVQYHRITDGRVEKIRLVKKVIA